MYNIFNRALNKDSEIIWRSCERNGTYMIKKNTQNIRRILTILVIISVILSSFTFQMSSSTAVASTVTLPVKTYTEGFDTISGWTVTPANTNCLQPGVKISNVVGLKISKTPISNDNVVLEKSFDISNFLSLNINYKRYIDGNGNHFLKFEWYDGSDWRLIENSVFQDVFKDKNTNKWITVNKTLSSNKLASSSIKIRISANINAASKFAYVSALSISGETETPPTVSISSDAPDASIYNETALKTVNISVSGTNCSGLDLMVSNLNEEFKSVKHVDTTTGSATLNYQLTLNTTNYIRFKAKVISPSGMQLVESDQKDIFVFKPLTLNALPSLNPSISRRWSVANPNDFDITVDWNVKNTTQKGSLTIQKNTTDYFYTNTISGTNTAIISVKGLQVDTKDSDSSTFVFKAPSVTKTDTGASISWDRVESAVKYTIYKSINNTNSFSVLVSDYTSTSFEDNTITSGNIYYYYVVAFDPKGASVSSASYGEINLASPSAISFVSPSQKTYIVGVTGADNLSAEVSATNSQSITLSLKKLGSSTELLTVSMITNSGNESSRTAKALYAFTTDGIYTLKAESLGLSGKTETQTMTLNVYKKLTIKNIPSYQPTKNLRWQITNPNPTDLLVNWSILGTSQSGVLTIPKNNEEYFYSKNESTNNAQLVLEGILSDSATAASNQTLVNPPEIDSISSDIYGVNITWQAPDYLLNGAKMTFPAKSYKIYRSTSPDSFLSTPIATVTNLTYSDPIGMNSVDTYYYKVVAEDEVGNTLTSNVKSITFARPIRYVDISTAGTPFSWMVYKLKTDSSTVASSTSNSRVAAATYDKFTLGEYLPLSVELNIQSTQPVLNPYISFEKDLYIKNIDGSYSKAHIQIDKIKKINPASTKSYSTYKLYRGTTTSTGNLSSVADTAATKFGYKVMGTFQKGDRIVIDCTFKIIADNFAIKDGIKKYTGKYMTVFFALEGWDNLNQLYDRNSSSVNNAANFFGINIFVPKPNILK
jgi:hypothetical protein